MAVPDTDVRASLVVECLESGTLVVKLVGEADLSNRQWLEDRLARVLKTVEGSVVLDLGELDSLDAASVRILNAFASAAMALGCHVAVGPASRILRRALEVCPVEALMPLHESREAALQSLGES
jgi:anti-anti-sigma factor